MQSIAYIPASNGSANASLMTVQNIRTAPATTIIVNTVAGVSNKFYGSMGTPHTFTDPVTSETITVISEETAVDFAGHVDGSNLEIDEIAPGFTDLGSQVGDIVIIRPVTEWANNIFNVLNVTHDDDGSLKDNIVTTDKILDGNITNAKLATGVGEPGGVWTGWTPTVANLVVGSGTLNCVYTRVGQKITGYVKFTLGTGSSVGTQPTFTVPIPAHARYATGNTIVGQSWGEDLGNTNYQGVVIFASSGTVLSPGTTVTNGSYANYQTFAAGAPFTWGIGDYFQFWFEYEAAA